MAALRLARVVVGAVVFLVGMPVLLWLVGGDPLQRLPSWAQVVVWFDQPSGRFTPTFLVGVAVWALWLLWAVFALLLVTEIIAVVTRWRVPALRLPAPLHRLVFGLAGTAAIAVTSTGPVHAAAGDQPAAVAANDSGAVIPRQAAARGPALIHVADTRYLYIVERHDTLSKIAKQWLGSSDRWPEICRLNKHRHFPRTGGTLRDCDLIYPGWDLRLPADARPPADATPATAPERPTPPPATTRPPATPSAAADPSRPTPPVTTAPENPATAHGTASATDAPTAVPPAPSNPTAPAPPSITSPVGGQPSPTAATDDDGISLSPSAWLPWSLAAALSATAALVWAQRRRRYTGQLDTDPPTDLPTPVRQLRRAVAHNPDLPRPDDTEPAGRVPDLVPLPPGGTGLIGNGAPSAARGVLVAALSTGGSHHPDARGEVITDAATVTALLGPTAVALRPWPRLHVTDTVDDALTAIEARLLHRSRILDDHALTDLDAPRQQPPGEEPLPPLVLITHTPPAAASMRAKVALTLGRDLHVSALLLGEWPHGATIDVTHDGHTTLVTDGTVEPVPPRLPVLDADATIQILTTLREAHTGEPPTAAPAPAAVVPLHTSRTDIEPDKPSAMPAPPAATGKARLRVLGQPRIDNITKPGRPLRAKALELAVFLTCHPDGATTRDIGEYLEPDARISQADQRVHTNASNLRHVLGRAGTTDTKNAYVIKTAGRYRLDPATVDVDVWTLRDLLRTATIATGARRRDLLTSACDLYTAPLAHGHDYEWLQPHRETVHRWGIEAHLLLADDLLHHDPQAASDLLDKALSLDRYNETLYTKAMHARHALGDADGITTLLHALTKALTDLDATPHDDTIRLATQLRSDLDQK